MILTKKVKKISRHHVKKRTKVVSYRADVVQWLAVGEYLYTYPPVHLPQTVTLWWMLYSSPQPKPRQAGELTIRGEPNVEERCPE